MMSFIVPTMFAALLACPGEVSEKVGWQCVIQEEGKPVYIPFEGYYESKGGRIESPKFNLDKAADENAWYAFSFDAMCAVDGYWWVDVFGADGKALPDMNSRLYASEDWRHYDIVVSVQPGAVAAQLAFVTKKGIKVRDVTTKRLSAIEAADWCREFYATLPQVDLSVPADAWDRLPKSKELLRQDKPITIVMLGDSIVNDTWCGNVSALIKERYPQAKIVLSVRGSTGCWYYRDPEQFDSYVLRYKPDLLMIGGISNGKDEADFSTAEADMTEVIRLAQKHSIEVAVMSPPPSYEFRKTVDDMSWDENVIIELYDSWCKRNRHWQPLRRDYQRAAVAKTGAAYFDLTTAPCDAILKSKKPLGWFKRDPAHNDDRGKQLIAQRLAAYFNALAKPEAAPELAPGEHRAKDLSALKDLTLPAGEPIVVVAGGEAKLPIVYANAQMNKWAAEQLRDTIAEMTGAMPQLICEKAGKPVTNAPAFYIGQTAAAKKAGLAAPTDHAEAHRVVTHEGSVYFLGKAEFAVTDWCERELGARYYWPMKPTDMYGGKGTNDVYGKCVVKTRGLAVRPVDWHDRPVFPCRDNWPYENTAWNRWGKGGNSHRGGVNVHAPHKWWKEPDALDHVEIFALSTDGKRPTSPLLCYGNPKTLEYYKMRVKKAIAEKTADPKAKDSSGGIVDFRKRVITISQWDCGVHCACDYCKKLFDEKLGDSGSGSPIIWGYFTREFAKWLKEEYPDWKIAILPYINTCDVPPDPEDPSKPLDLSAYGNVESELCTMPGLAMLKNEECKRREEDLIRQWVKCTGNPVVNWHYSCWPAEFTSAPFVYGETIQRHYSDMRKDLAGTFINGGYDIARLSLSGYVWMRCLYNPEIDVQAVYDGFASRMFGPAAKPMRELIRMQEDGWNRQWESDLCSVKNIYTISYPREDVLKMLELFAEAERLAAGDRVVKARIAWYRSGFDKFLVESEEHASGTAFVPHQIKKAVAPPVIDGKLDDACWAKAEEHAFVSARDKTNSVPQYAGCSRMVWYPGEGGGVTFGFRFAEPAMKAMKEGVKGDPWGQDTYEIFLDVSGSGDGHFYQILIDGTSRPSFFTDGIGWKPQGVKVAKFDGDDFWSVEVFVPFSDLKDFPKAQIPTTSANGCIWTGNFCRWRVGDSRMEPKEIRQPGSKGEMSRLYTRHSHWNKDPAAFGPMPFVE